jgi:hypothetical protein
LTCQLSKRNSAARSHTTISSLPICHHHPAKGPTSSPQRRSPPKPPLGSRRVYSAYVLTSLARSSTSHLETTTHIHSYLVRLRLNPSPYDHDPPPPLHLHRTNTPHDTIPIPTPSTPITILPRIPPLPPILQTYRRVLRVALPGVPGIPRPDTAVQGVSADCGNDPWRLYLGGETGE